MGAMGAYYTVENIMYLKCNSSENIFETSMNRWVFLAFAVRRIFCLYSTVEHFKFLFKKKIA